MDSITESPQRFFRDLSGPDTLEAAVSLWANSQNVQLLLDSMSSEESHAIIGEGGDEYTLLHAAMWGIYGLLWAQMRRFGLRHNSRSNKKMCQSLVMMVHILNRAYAMGIRRGQSQKEARDQELMEAAGMESVGYGMPDYDEIDHDQPS